MRTTNKIAPLVVLLLFFVLVPADSKASSAPGSFAPLVKKEMPAVVNISTRTGSYQVAGPLFNTRGGVVGINTVTIANRPHRQDRDAQSNARGKPMEVTAVIELKPEKN